MKKRGRKSNHYVTADGKTIVGLGKVKDGRWKIIETGFRFSEPDETKALERFKQLTQSENDDAAELLDQHTYDKNKNLWRWFADQLRSRPHYVAIQTGIEQLAYLADLKPTEPLPSLDEIAKQWSDHARCKQDGKQKVIRAWNDFVLTTGIGGLRDITAAVAVKYQDAVYHRDVASGKQQAHLFGSVRRMLSFAKSRAIAVKTITECLSYLSIMRPSVVQVSLDPKPIEVADWQKLYAKADGEDLAMILLMLNGAFYIGEVIELEWSDIKDGCITTHRAKTGKCVRICKLWPQTIDALAKIRKRRGDKIFYNYTGQPIKVCGAQRRWQRLALKAGLAVRTGPKTIKCRITASQLRDGAFTAAVQANITDKLCNLLVGHRCGMSDHYVKRNPAMVAPACEAVFRHYFGKESAGALTELKIAI